MMFKKVLLYVIPVLLVFASNAQPLNDDCANSTPITIPNSGNVCVNGTLAGATDDGQFSACENAGSNEVWFTYIATGANNTVTVTPSGASPATNLVVNIMNIGCGSTAINACNAAPTANGTATTSWAFTPGTQIWIFVSSNSGSTGTFQLCVSSITTPPSTGKDCNTAAPVCNLNSFTSTVALGSNGFQPPCFNTALQQPIIFKFTVGQTGLLNWLATPTCGAPNATRTEFDWAVYDVTAGCPGTVVACNYNYTGSLPFMIPVTTAQGMQGGPAPGCVNTLATGSTAAEICQGVTVTAGNTYVIMLDQYTLGSTCSLAFNFNGSTFQPAPSSIFTVAPATGCGSITATFTNTSVGATTYAWDFGDGTTSGVQNPPTKVYSAVGTYLVSLTTTTPSGCSDVASQSIQVFPGSSVTVNSDTICTGQSATLTATPSIQGGTYLWSPGGATTSSITVSPATTTNYTVTYNLSGCTSSATATVNVPTSFTVSAGSDTSICTSQTIQLNGSVSPAGAYTYLWTPGTALSNTNTLTPLANPTSPTTYTLSVTDAFGCSNTDNMNVSISGVGLPINATVSPGVTCPGELVQLNANILPTTCGPAVACSGNNQSTPIGAGTTVQPGTAFQTPTLFGNFDRSGRNQMLYLASELNGALGSACVIKSMSFNIAIFNSNAWLENFVVKMGCTSATSLSTWENNLTTVFTSNTPGYQPANGWSNTITLATPFAWDGTSNLIIDICWNNPITFGNQNNKAQCTTTAFNSYLYSGGAANQCGTTSGANVSTLRPNIRFNYCYPDITSFNINWTPNTGANAVSNPAIPNPTANPITTTNYTISIVNGACTSTDIVTAQVDDSRVDAGSDVNACPGNTTTLTATAIGTLIPGPASFQWRTIAGALVGNTASVNVNPLVTTTYVVTMSGGHCLKYDTVTINITGLTVNALPVNSTCNGYDNGKVYVTSNGIAPFTYTWSPNASTGNADSAINLGPGTYLVTVGDVNGCSGTASASTTEPTLLTFTSSVTHVTCFGGNNGAITITPSGGTGTYTYQWSNLLPPNGTVNSLTAGNYLVTVFDANLCSATANIAVNQPTQIVFGNAVIQDVRCFSGNDGSITISASGGTGTYTYSWSHNAGLNSPSATNLTANSYTVTVSDLSNCSVSASYNVSQPAAGMVLNAPTVTDATCFGGSDGTATINTTGGTTPYTYLWSAGAQTTPTAINLAAGTYSYTVTDDSLCTVTATVTVNEPLQIGISGVVSNVQCFGNSDGGVDVTIANGVAPFTYLWSDGSASQDLTAVVAGPYSVTVTDNTSCTQSTSFTITEPAVLVLNAPTITNVSCLGGNNGSVTANPAGGTAPYSYLWAPSGNTPTISSLTAGTYDVTTADANGCSVTASYQVTEPATALAFGNAVVVDVLCNGLSTGSITVSVTGGTGAYTYSWSHNVSLNNTTASSLAAGTYTVTVTDDNGCTLSSSNTITQPAAISIVASSITNVSCAGGTDGSVTLSVSGGVAPYTYTWNGVSGSNPQGNLPASAYTVAVTDANACTATATLTVTEPVALSVTFAVTNVTCFGYNNGSIEANPTGGNQPYQYLWSDALGQTTKIAGNLTAGNYRCTITDATGCNVIGSAQVAQPGALTFTVQTTQVRCPGDANGIINVNGTGGTPPYTYAASLNGTTWFTSTTGTIENLAAGTYQVKVTDANQCEQSATAVVPSPVADVFTSSVDSTSCYGPQYADGALHVEGQTFQNMPYSYGVDGGAQQYSGDFYNMTAGAHIVKAINNWGCASYVTVIVPEPVNGVADVFPDDTTIQLGESIQLSTSFTPYPSSSIVSYNWTPSLGLSCVDCANPVATPYGRLNEYTFTITYNNNCTADATVTVWVENDLKVFIPNSFSPNGDGNNDVWQIYGEGIKHIDLKIFNRWGEKVFESSNQFEGWNGNYRGAIQNPGVFVFTVNITYLDGKEYFRQGSITLIR